MDRLNVGDYVQHFKREYVKDSNSNEYLYKIIGIGYHSETKEKLVIYQALYSNDHIEEGHICCRPYDMFMGEVDHEKYPDIKHKYRFERYSI